ncbi:MAG: rhodanese-like domain-containing protein [Phycisphaerales bacterium JB050]
MNTTAESVEVTDVSPEQLRHWQQTGEAVIIDVREPFEYGEERIDGADLHPLSAFDAEAIREKYGDRKLVFQCRSGRRSLDAAARYAKCGGEPYHLAGGIEAWAATGLPVYKPVGAPKIGVMRQVQMTAGSLVLIGVLLGAFVNPWFLILSGFVGSGLLFAGATGWCGMALLLAKMPWNAGVNQCGANCSVS